MAGLSFIQFRDKQTLRGFPLRPLIVRHHRGDGAHAAQTGRAPHLADTLGHDVPHVTPGLIHLMAASRG